MAEPSVDDLIEPVCFLAALRPTNDWPNEVKRLVAAARAVKERYGFEVESGSSKATE